MTATRRSAAHGYALQMHGEQTYKAHPEAHHLDTVAATFAPCSTVAQVVACLHGIEDADASVEDVRARLDDAVAA